jgi:hypothetical protein
MGSVIIPVACDWHAVYSIHEDGVWYGLYCEECDETYPPVVE